jgi:adhesin HecA-like repeat protein
MPGYGLTASTWSPAPITWTTLQINGRQKPLGDKPDFAFDTAALGGMYANSIRLIATEAGVGVNLSGHLEALTGALQVNAAGEVRIVPSARLRAGGDLEITTAAGSLNNAGQLLAGVGAGTATPTDGQGSIKLAGEKQGSIVNTGTLAAGKDVTLQADRVEVAGGSLSAPGRLTFNPTPTPGLVKISAAHVSGGTVELQATHFDNAGGELTAAGDLTITANSLNNQGGKFTAGGNLSAAISYTLDNSRASLSAGGMLRLSAMQLVNTGGVITGQSVALDLKKSPVTYSSGRVDNTGGLIQARETLTLFAPWSGEDEAYSKAPHNSWLYPVTLKNQGGKFTAGGDLTATVPYELNNAQGILSGGGAVSLRTQKLANVGGVITGQTVLATLQPSYFYPDSRSRPDSRNGRFGPDGSSDSVDNIGGLIQADEALTLTAKTIRNTQTQSSDSSHPLGLGGKTVTLTSKSDFYNIDGSVVADETLTLNAERLINKAGGVFSSKSADITVSVLDNLYSYPELSNPSPGIIEAGERLSIKANALAGSGKLQSEGDLLLTINYHPQRSMWAGTKELINHNKIFAAKDLTINVNKGAVENALQGELVANGTTTLNVEKTLTNKGVIEGRTTHIKAADVINEGRGHLMHLSEEDSSQPPGIYAREHLKIVTRALGNDSGKLSAGESLTILHSATPLATVQQTGQGTGLAPRLNNRHGQIAAPRVVIKMPQVDNPGGQILGDYVSIEALQLTNRAGSPGGVIAARQALNLGVKELENGAQALLYSQGDLSIGEALDEHNQAVGVAQTISNTGGIIDAHGQVVAQARTITNGQGATVLAGHTVLWPKEALTNDASSQVITGDFLLETDRFTNSGRLQARTIAMTVNHFDNVGKLVRADQHLALEGKGPESTLDSRQGLLMSAGSMALKFDRFDNTQGTVLAAGDADVHIGQMLGSGRWVVGGKLDLQSPGSWTQGPDALMDAGHLDLRVGSLYNQGGVYGDTVSLQAPQIDNAGGVIAARSRLEIGVGTLTNHAQGWIASADKLTVGGALNAPGRAVGQADRVQNRGATLESLGDFTLTAAQLSNENARLETVQATVAGPAAQFSIQPKGESERIDSSRLIEIKVGNKDRYAIYPSATVVPPFSYAQLRSWVAQAVGLDGRLSKEQEKFYQVLQTIEASLAAQQPVPRYLLRRLAEPLEQLARYPELQDASLTSRQVQRQAELFVAGQIDALGQDPVFLHNVQEGIGSVLFSWFKRKEKVSQQEADAVRYAPLLEQARHHAAWRRAVLGGLFKAETGGAIELLKAWRRLENRPVIDEYPGRFWGRAAVVEPPVLPLLPRLTQLGYLTPDQARQAQPYYAAQILATPRWAREWREFETERRVTQTQVTHSEPGQVLAGGDLNLHIGQQGLNSNSHVLAGGKLAYTGQDLTLESAKSERLLHETGRTRQAYIKGGGGWFGPGERLKRTKWQPYEPGRILLSSTPIAQIVEKTDVPHSSRTIGARRLEAPLPAQAHAPTVDPASRVTSWTQVDGAQVRQLDGVSVPHSVLYRAAPAGSASLYQQSRLF